MAFLDFLKGTPAQTQQFQRFTPEQQQALSKLLSMGQQGLQNPTQGFEPIAQQARTQFEQQTVPTLAERFTSMGGGSLSSPAFSSQLGQAGSGLEGSLAALKSQYGLGQQSHFANLLGMGLSPQFETGYTPRQPGFAEQAGQGLAGGLGSLLPLLGLLFGGPVGGAIGGAGSAGLSGLMSLLNRPQ